MQSHVNGVSWLRRRRLKDTHVCCARTHTHAPQPLLTWASGAVYQVIIVWLHRFIIYTDWVSTDAKGQAPLAVRCFGPLRWELLPPCCLSERPNCTFICLKRTHRERLWWNINVALPHINTIRQKKRHVSSEALRGKSALCPYKLLKWDAIRRPTRSVWKLQMCSRRVLWEFREERKKKRKHQQVFSSNECTTSRLCPCSDAIILFQ